MADQIIEVPGQGQVAFPDTMSDAEITAAIRRMSGGGEQAPQTPEGKLMGFLRGAGGRVAEIPGQLKTLLTTNPLTTLGNAYESQLAQFGKAGEAAAQGRVSEALGYGAAGLLPLLGPAAASIGEDVGSADPNRLGRAGIDAALTALPAAPKGVAAAGRAIGRGAARVARSPIAGSVAGGVVGGITGGVPGAIAGASGGGMAGQAIRALERLSEKAAPVSNELPRAARRMGVERFSPNVPATGTGFGEAAAPLTSSIERYSPNLPSEGPAGFGDPAAAMRSLVRTGAEQYAPEALPFTGEVTAPGRAAFNLQAPELLEAGSETVAAPGFDLGPVVEAPVSRAVSRRAELAARAMEAVKRFQEARQHGIAGFRNLPEMVPGELDRISRNIAAITGR